MFLSPGWNKLIYTFIGKGIDVKDSLIIFYSKGGQFLSKDDFNDGIIDEKWTVDNEAENSGHTREENGFLFLNYKRERKDFAIFGPLLKVDPGRKLIIEIRSLVGDSPCYYANDFSVRINNRYGFFCRQDCNIEENAKVVCDLINGTVECYVNGELYAIALKFNATTVFSSLVTFVLYLLSFLLWNSGTLEH